MGPQQQAGVEAPAEPRAAQPVLEASGLVKRFGPRTALEGISFSAAAGEVVAVIGPNGAGKTTLLSILAGIQSPDEGELSIAPSETGWVPQEAGLYRKLTVAENLRLFARLEEVADADAAVESMLDQAGLRDRANDQVASLSGGNRQRVNIAIGLLAAPGTLLLDEPSAALDPRQRERLWEFISAMAERGTTVVFSTHNVGEAERHAARLVVLDGGERIFWGTPAEFKAEVETVAPAAEARDFEAAFVEFLQQRAH